MVDILTFIICWFKLLLSIILILKAEYCWMENPQFVAGTSEAGNSMTLNHNILRITHTLKAARFIHALFE